MDLDKLEAGFAMVLEGLELDAGDPGETGNPHLKDTPKRTALAWYEEICAGLREPAPDLEVFPVEEGMETGLVALDHIPVKSLCAHHLLPFHGLATVAYLPGDTLCGLSKLSRVVNHFARRPQLQEHLTLQIAHYLQETLHPRGVAVLIQASHFCMEMRGVNHPGQMTTQSLLGDFETNLALRADFQALASRHPEP